MKIDQPELVDGVFWAYVKRPGQRWVWEKLEGEAIEAVEHAGQAVDRLVNDIYEDQQRIEPSS
tara:strand:- start:776 stop:964 length:189 start_codon:yes stop_codon:yes gene_type:complete